MRILPGWPRQGLATARHDWELTRPDELQFLKLRRCDTERLNFRCVRVSRAVRDGFSNYANAETRVFVRMFHERIERTKCLKLVGSSRLFSPSSIHVRFSLDTHYGNSKSERVVHVIETPNLRGHVARRKFASLCDAGLRPNSSPRTSSVAWRPAGWSSRAARGAAFHLCAARFRALHGRRTRALDRRAVESRLP